MEATETQRTQLAHYWRRVSMDRESAYDLWLDSLGLPVHKGYYVEDVRTIELGNWEERECRAAFLKLRGQEGVTEARVTEIPSGATLPSMRFALDEIVYVAEGRGLTTVWAEDGGKKHTFEWEKHSLFMIPRNFAHQFSNVQGHQPARLFHYNYLPVSLSIVPEPTFFFNNKYFNPDFMSSLEDDWYSEAKIIQPSEESRSRMAFWVGNFFPDMRAWDNLVPFRGRGAGGHVVWIRYPTSTMTNHMSVFPSGTYKKAHRHGPGVVIIIPSGEGYSVMWPEGEERVVCPWHEGSVFVPPDQWFHQHFNAGADPARYLAFHGPPSLSAYSSERVRNRERDQIEYPNEDPWIRQTFEAELAKRGLKTAMVEEAYQDANYEWTYTGDN
ncbi:MAG TPA: cupin domain-containing protein [Chloroflexota bacterium]